MTTPPPQPPVDPRQADTTWSVLAHLSIFVLSLIGPLAIYLVYKDRSPFTRHHAAEALNFHLTLLIATLVSFVLVFVVIGIVLLPAVILAGWVFGVIAAVAAGNGTLYRYPLSIRFVS